MILKFTVPGEPKSKGRHRSTRSGITYTPVDTEIYENLIRHSYLQEHQQRGSHDGPVVLEILAYFRIPGSKSKKLQERMRSGLVRPMKTPDVDNVMKSVQDGLNGIAYRDDRQIITASISKFYDDNPRLVVSLTYLEEVEDDV